MNAPATDQTPYIKPPEDYGLQNVSNALLYLWKKSADTLTDAELTWFSGLMYDAEEEMGNLYEVVNDLGCIVSGGDTGNFQDKNSVSHLLFNIAHQINTIKGMYLIGSRAEDRLKNKNLYTTMKDVD